MEKIRISLFFCLSFFLSNIVFAQVGGSGPAMQVPEAPVCTDMQLMKSIPCSDGVLFFSQGKSIVQRGFNEGNYKLLDETYKNWCKGKERFPDGRWKLSQYGVGLENNFSAWNTWDKDLAKIKKWQSEYPASETAKFVEGIYWYSYAWKARGEGYARTVSPEGWLLFNERLQKSKDAFNYALKSDHACPAVYARLIDSMRAIGDKESDVRSVFEEGIKKYPQYHNIYFAMANFYQPKWHGSVDSYERFANYAVEKTKRFEGQGMYARLYWLVDSEGNIPFNPKLNAPPYWDRLKQGYEDLLKLYPSSIHNMGEYANVACRSSDSETYLKLREKIDGYQNDVDFYDSVDACDLRHGWKK